jgi:hypothetical protein
MRTSINTIHFLKPFLAIGFAVILLCAQVSVSHATPLTLTSGLSPASGSTLLSSITEAFSSASLSGTLISSVYSGDTDNTLGGLTFTYEILLSSGSPDSASKISISSFIGTGGNINVGFNSPGVIPDSADLEDGNEINFDFSSDGYILPGQDSALLVVQTAVTAYSPGSASIVDDVGTPSIPSLAVPDVTGIGSFMLALGLMAGFGRFTKVAVAKA